VSYATFDAAGQEKLKLTFTPVSVLVDGSCPDLLDWDSLNHVWSSIRAKAPAVDTCRTAPGCRGIGNPRQSIGDRRIEHRLHGEHSRAQEDSLGTGLSA